LSRIQSNTKKMSDLIDDLLAFSRVGRKALQVESVDMNRLVQEVLNDFGTDNGLKQVEVVVESLPSCKADRSLLKQVWINLISNAIKYSSKRENPRIEIRHITQDHKTAYLVKDNGVGFDMQYVDKLFGVFQRLHREDEFEGTGIGLATVSRIIERHGGRVWAEAQLNNGATFYITLGD
jgi:light-regulated signal transduction histidine kinase (bacteriophytochrome)